MVDQVEFADVIIVNKIDLISQDEQDLLMASLHKLNPVAKVITAVKGKVDPSEILNTNLFNFEEAEVSAGWIQELEGIHTPETEEYGITSFVYRNEKPFHPERFWKLISNDFPQTVIRSKGLFWMASRPDQALNWSQAGGSMKAEGAGVWWASMPMAERMSFNNFTENQDIIEARWTAEFGDRLTELVMIGIKMDEKEVKELLDSCICNETEIEQMQAGVFSTEDLFQIPTQFAESFTEN